MTWIRNLSRAPKWSKAAIALMALAGFAFYIGHRPVSGRTSYRTGLASVADQGPFETEIPGLLVSHRALRLDGIPDGSIATAEFQLSTIGHESFQIQNLKTSCGCMSASADHRNVVANEPVKITIRINTAQTSGAVFEKDLAVLLGGPLTGRSILLHVTGNIDYSHELVIFPNILDLGPVVSGESVEGTLFLRGAPALLEQLPPSIELTATNHSIYIQDKSVIHGSANTLATRSLKVHFKGSSAFHGDFRSDLVLKIAGAQDRSLDVSINAVVGMPFTVTPARLLITALGSGSGQGVTVLLRSIGTSAIALQQIKSDLPLDFESSSPGSAETVRLLVHLRAGVHEQMKGTTSIVTLEGESVNIPTIISPSFGGPS